MNYNSEKFNPPGYQWQIGQTNFHPLVEYLWLSFTVTNGVRQGGILSPILFNVYMDDLSKSLKLLSNIGCNINGVSTRTQLHC